MTPALEKTLERIGDSPRACEPLMKGSFYLINSVDGPHRTIIPVISVPVAGSDRHSPLSKDYRSVILLPGLVNVLIYVLYLFQ